MRGGHEEDEDEDFFNLLETDGQANNKYGVDCTEEDEEDKYGMMVDDESSLGESSNDSTSASASLSWLSTRQRALSAERGCRAGHGPQVDVRMIDFAHTTYAGYDGEPTVYSGPDTGYLLGLDSLVRLLREVEDLSTSVDKK